MPLVSVGVLLAPISVEEPSGPNLEYDAEFGKLERLAQGKPEQQMGSTVLAAEEPDWKAVARDAQALLARTKDLRVAIHLAKALLRLGAIEGFSEGLAVLRGLVDGFWDSVHPSLDPDDDNDPTMRLNTLLALVDGPTVAAVRSMPLVRSRLVGKFGLREIAFATGEVPLPPDQSPLQMSTIDGAFDSLDLGELETTAAAARNALDDVNTIESLITERVGASRAVSLSKLSTLLAAANKHLSAALARRQTVQSPVGQSKPAEPGPGQVSQALPQRSSVPGEISSREDVTAALDRIISYYQRHEPTSPLPIVMKRAKRMVTMSFLEIIKDVAPDAAAQAALLRGHSDTEEGS